MTNAIATLDDFRSLDLSKPQDVAAAMVQSGFFKDIRSMSQAVVKVVAGRDLGLSPFASMTGIDLVEGHLRLRSKILAGLVKNHATYDYRVREWDATKCRVEFFEKDDGERESIGWGEFTIEEARAAGLVRSRSAWEKWPKAMLFARALSQGVNAHCPDVTGGIRAYTEGDDFVSGPLAPVDPAPSTLEATLEDDDGGQGAPPPAEPTTESQEPSDAGEGDAEPLCGDCGQVPCICEEPF